MVIASHVTFSCYGFWPPNDDRGSWSDHVWANHLQRFGEAKKVSTRRSIAHLPHNREKNKAIREALLYPIVKLDAAQRDAVVDGIAEAVDLLKLDLLACAVMPDHVHVVARRHQLHVEDLMGYLKRFATKKLSACDLHPLKQFVGRRGAAPTPWAHGGWKRFISNEADLPDAIRYLEQNPVRAGLGAQTFSFVKAL